MLSEMASRADRKLSPEHNTPGAANTTAAMTSSIRLLVNDGEKTCRIIFSTVDNPDEVFVSVYYCNCLAPYPTTITTATGEDCVWSENERGHDVTGGGCPGNESCARKRNKSIWRSVSPPRVPFFSEKGGWRLGVWVWRGEEWGNGALSCHAYTMLIRARWYVNYSTAIVHLFLRIIIKYIPNMILF